MAKRRERRRELPFADGRLQPSDLLFFIESRNFTKQWVELGLDDEFDLLSLQLAIMADPTGAPRIRATGGLRKLRFKPPRWNIGKRGSTRVCYVFFEPQGIVLLLAIYDKSHKSDLTEEERSVMRRLIEWSEMELKRRGRLS